MTNTVRFKGGILKLSPYGLFVIEPGDDHNGIGHYFCVKHHTTLKCVAACTSWEAMEAAQRLMSIGE